MSEIPQELQDFIDRIQAVLRQAEAMRAEAIQITQGLLQWHHDLAERSPEIGVAMLPCVATLQRAMLELVGETMQ